MAKRLTVLLFVLALVAAACGDDGDTSTTEDPDGGAETTDEPDTDYARRLTREHGVACIPVSVFCASPPPEQRLLRFCFAKDEDTLERAAEILCKI